MKPQQPLQTLIDPFVRDFGGEIVSEVIGKVTPSKNADYAFRQHNVIAELKALENDSFGASFKRNMGDLTASWQQRGFFLLYGAQRIDIGRLHPTCQREFMDLLGRPLQENVIAKASKQIGETKSLIKMPTAKGLLIVASDGNEDLLPNTVWWLLCRTLQKRHPDGTPQFSNIDGLIYFTPRMPVENPKTGKPTMIWHAGSRNGSDDAMIVFLRAISEAWPAHVARVSGLEFRREVGQPLELERARFVGVEPRMPKIKMNI